MPTIYHHNGLDMWRPPSSSPPSLPLCHNGEIHICNTNHDIYRTEEHTGIDFIDAASNASSTHNATWDAVAVADGHILLATSIASTGKKGACTPAPGPACRYAVMVLHTVGALNTNYYEQFISVYWHLDSLAVTYPGTVSQGDIIGEVGDTGTDNDHLHFSVMKITNNNQFWREDPDEAIHMPAPDDDRVDMSLADGPFIDPFGWKAWASCADPSWLFEDQGALSMNLWTSGSIATDWNHAATGTAGPERHDP